MRIRRFFLRQYGKFESLDLEFPDNKLCVVYGENEAGKTSNLVALADMLFGFAHQTDYDFQFPGKMMRVGAAMVTEDGRESEFWRRKGRKGTLMDADEKVLDDDALRPFLGQADRGLFERAFGLSHERLRLGGEAMLRAGGELGDSLVEAGAGIGDLTRLREDLQSQAAALYGPRRASSKAIYAQLTRYHEARKKKQALSLSPEVWSRAVKSRDEAQARLDETATEQAKLEREFLEMARQSAVVPILREIDAVNGEIESLGPPVDLPADPTLRWRAIQDGLERAKRQREDRTEKLRELEKWLSDNPAPDDWLNQAEQITVLRDQLGEITKNQRDIPLHETECVEARRDLTRILERLGLQETDPAAVAPPDDLRLKTLESLVREGHLLIEERDKLAQRAQSRDRTLEMLSDAIEVLDVTKNPAESLKISATLRTRLESLADGDDLARQLAELDDHLERSLAALPHWTGPLESLVRGKFPVRAHLQEIDRETTKLDQSIQEVERDLQNTLQDQADLKLEIAQLGSETIIPTLENLKALRSERDQVWQRIKAQPDRIATLVADFERLMEGADEIADRRESEAGRIAEFERLKRSTEKADRRLEKLEHQSARLAEERAGQAQAWQNLWAMDHLADPGPPRAMIEWLDQVDKIRDLVAKRSVLQQNLERHRQVMGDLVAALSAFGDFYGEGADRLAIAKRLDSLEVQFSEQSRLWEELRDLEARKAAAANEREMIDAEQEANGLRLGKWRESWRAIMQTLGHPADTSPEQGEEALQLWREARLRIDRIAGLERRISSMRARCDEFERAVGSLREVLGEEDLSLPEMAQRLDIAGQLAVRRSDRLAERDALATALDDDERAIAALTRERSDLLDSAGARDGREFAEVVAEDDRRRSLLARLEDARNRLRDAASGEDEQSLRDKIGGVDLQALSESMTKIEDRKRILEAERETHRNELEQARLALQTLGREEHAEQAAQEMQGALANLARDSRRWIRLRAASLLLRSAIDRFRGEFQNPLLAAASTHFTKLTGGSFADLDVDFDENDTAVLVGRRPDGQRVDVAGMSDGTRDQLYLALRLAAVNRYNDRQEPLPFIGDDLFLNFDDDRAAAGLVMLGEMPQCQVILFTHHAHFVELARHHLADQCAVLTL